jgi:heterotetrameric sarcosine oxidase delta subunit
MIRIPCPFCGPRNSSEFAHVGEVGSRPDVTTATRQEWRAYLYVHDNPLGWVRETWFHRAGCRRYLEAERHTDTNEVRWARPVGWRHSEAEPPATPADSVTASVDGPKAGGE